MLAFSILLVVAGALLSRVARLPLLVLALAVMVVAIATVTFLGIDASQSAVVSVVVAIVALQVGYGLGVIARGVVHKYAATRTDAVAMKETRHDRERSRAP